MDIQRYEKIFRVWPLVLKRLIVNWRTLSTVVIGVVLACSIMSGTVIFFDSLKEIALDESLRSLADEDTNILIQAEKGPTNYIEASKLDKKVHSFSDGLFGAHIRDVLHGARTATFFFSLPGLELDAGKDNLRTYFAYLPKMNSRVTIIDGVYSEKLEQDFGTNGTPVISVLIDAKDALLFELGVGDLISAVPYWDDSLDHVTVNIAGVFEKNDGDDLYWSIEQKGFMYSASKSFKTIPLYLPRNIYMEGLASSLVDLETTYVWMFDIDRESINSSNASQLASNITYFGDRLGSELNRFVIRTELDKSLKIYDTRILFTKIQMYVVLIMVTFVVLYYVVILSSLMIEQRRFEVSKLKGRGATDSQILSVFVIEGVTISFLSTILGPIIAAIVISLLGLLSDFREINEDTFLSARLTYQSFLMSFLGGLLSFLALMIPSIQASRYTVSDERAKSNRPNRISFITRYYIDVLILIIALFLFNQLNEQGSMAAQDILGNVNSNQIMLAVPAIILVASALVILRIFPLLMSLLSRVLSRYLPIGLVLGMWHMSRSPSNYARLVLLLILMTGLGVFVASFAGTLNRNFEERVYYSHGSDLRLSDLSLNSAGLSKPLTKKIEAIDGVSSISTSIRLSGTDVTKTFGSDPITILGFDTENFTQNAWYRSDFSESTLPEIAESLEISNKKGIELPDRARSFGILVKSDKSRPSVALIARMRDSNGRYISYDLGRLDSGGWTNKEVEIFGSRRRFQIFPSRPLTLMSVGIVETIPQRSLSPGSILIDSARVRLSTGEVVNLEDFREVTGWQTIDSSIFSSNDNLALSEISAKSDFSARFTWSDGPSMTMRGIYPSESSKPIPAIVNSDLIRKSRYELGDRLKISIGGQRIDVVLINQVAYFPTINPIEDDFLILDSDSLIHRINIGALIGSTDPNEFWISYQDGIGQESKNSIRDNLIDDPPFPYGQLWDTESMLEETRIDPLVKAGWHAILLIAFSSILLLSVIGFFSHAYISFRNRRFQFALLRTIGLSSRQLMSSIWIEQVLIIILGMAVGTWMGGRLSEAVMPFLSIDDYGNQVVPPFVIEVDWPNLLLTYGVMIVIFSIVIGFLIFLANRLVLNKMLRLGDT